MAKHRAGLLLGRLMMSAIGASRVEQLTQNIASLDVAFTTEQRARLDAISAPPVLNPYFIFGMPTARIFGGQEVQRWAS